MHISVCGLYKVEHATYVVSAHYFGSVRPFGAHKLANVLDASQMGSLFYILDRKTRFTKSILSS